MRNILNNIFSIFLFSIKSLDCRGSSTMQERKHPPWRIERCVFTLSVGIRHQLNTKSCELIIQEIFLNCISRILLHCTFRICTIGFACRYFAMRQAYGHRLIPWLLGGNSIDGRMFRTKSARQNFPNHRAVPSPSQNNHLILWWY